MTAFASVYAGFLNHLYSALEYFIKANIHLFELRTTVSGLLLDNLPRAIKPLLDLHENTRRMLELAESEANVLEAVIQEVSPHVPAHYYCID